MLEEVHRMSEQFFEKPILNSPYAFPGRHWELDVDGQPTNRILENRRRSDLIKPVLKTKKQRQDQKQSAMLLGASDELSTTDQEYNPTPIINEVRGYVETWLKLPNPDQWLVTPETARLLQHWRHHKFEGSHLMEATLASGQHGKPSLQQELSVHLRTR